MSFENSVQTPQISPSLIQELAKNLYEFQVIDSKQLNGYDDKNYWLKKVIGLGDKRTIWPHGYVLKITNERDSKLEKWLEAQTLLLLHLNKNGLLCPEPVCDTNGNFLTQANIQYSNHVIEGSSGIHTVRLMKFIPGKIICTTEYTFQILKQVGHLLARFHILAEDFYHPGFDIHNPIWALKEVSNLKQLINVFDEKDKQDILLNVIETFDEQVLKNIHLLSTGLLHGDFNEQNILVDKDEMGNENVISFLDVGDSHRGPYVFDVGLAILYLMLDTNSIPIMDVGGYILTGYMENRQLTEEEFRLLKVIICARLCQSLIMGMYTYKKNPIPENSYVLTTQTKGWPLLRVIWNMSENDLYSRWNEIISQCKKNVQKFE